MSPDRGNEEKKNSLSSDICHGMTEVAWRNSRDDFSSAKKSKYKKITLESDLFLRRQ